jgi:hypothetical protein
MTGHYMTGYQEVRAQILVENLGGTSTRAAFSRSWLEEQVATGVSHRCHAEPIPSRQTRGASEESSGEHSRRTCPTWDHRLCAAWALHTGERKRGMRSRLRGHTRQLECCRRAVLDRESESAGPSCQRQILQGTYPATTPGAITRNIAGPRVAREFAA